MTTRHEICPAESLEPGERVIVEIADRSIGVFNVDGEYFAINNTCPHMHAPLCEGRLAGTGVYEDVGHPKRESTGEIIKCPWHGWEFDIETGESTFNPHQYRARTYDAAVEQPCDQSGTKTACSETGGADASMVTEQAATGDDSADETSESNDDAGEPDYLGEPPVDTFETAVESEIVVVYV